MHISGSEGRAHSHMMAKNRRGAHTTTWRVTPQMVSTVQSSVRKLPFRHFIRSFGVSEHGAPADFRASRGHHTSKRNLHDSR